MARSLFAALLLILFAAPLAAQEPWVDPRVRLLLRNPRPVVSAEPDPRPRPDRPGRLPERSALGVRAGPTGAPEVHLLVELESDRALAGLRSLGATVGTVAGRVATVRVPLSALPALTRLQGLTRIEAARPLHLHNDEANEASRVDRVRRREGSWFLGSAGAGVVVGVIDTGLDYGHGDFLDREGVPRTLALWDQAQDLYCDSARLRSANCASSDVHGHGTHVTGTAAGDGSGVGAQEELAYRFAGVAPEADIVAVKYSFLSDAQLVDGVAWMFEQAEALGKPAVVNISLGSQLGAHDGTSLLEQGLDALTGPGRIIVTSAGNEGNAANTRPALTDLLIHASAEPAPGAPETVTFRITDYSPSADRCNDFALLDLWYGADQTLTFTVVRPNGTRVAATTGASVVQDDAAGQVAIEAPAAPSPGNGDRNAMIEVSGCGGSRPQPGEWRLELSSNDPPSEPVHLWIAFSALGSSGFALGEDGFDSRYVVGIPATARQLISVGAYTSRVCWPTSGGTTCSSGVFGFTQTVGDIAFFSSTGPTRDGRIKPEITAPGMFLMSSRSATAAAHPSLVAPGGRHRVEVGTSMSSPHVAGAVALLLQHDPTLTPDGVRDILAATARTDEFTSRDYSGGGDGTPNSQWGHGKLDARAALETLADPAVAVDLWLSERSDTLPLGATLPLRGIVHNAFGDSLAAPSAWTSSAPSVAEVSGAGVVTPVALGTAIITAIAGAFSETVFIEVVPPATLVVEAAALEPAPETVSRVGTRLPLLDLRFVVDGFEGVLVDSLGFDASGRDPAARLLLVHDLDNDGRADADEPVLADTVLALEPEPTRVVLSLALVVPAQDTLDMVAALELSGAVPHGAVFQLVFRPELTSSEGLRSGELDRRSDPAGAVASATAGTGVLTAGEIFTLSENPVRSDAGRLVLSFAEQPSVAAVYTLRGARVADLMRRLDPSGVRVDWNLTTDEGGAVAPGIYFLVVRVGSRLIREKLIVARSFGTP